MSPLISPYNNRILSALPDDDLQLLSPYLQMMDLKQKHVLYDIGQEFDYIYFIEQGVASVITTMEGGASIEVGMAGFEGMTPVAALLGDKTAEQHIVMQLPGRAARISMPDGSIIKDRFMRDYMRPLLI